MDRDELLKKIIKRLISEKNSDGGDDPSESEKKPAKFTKTMNDDKTFVGMKRVEIPDSENVFAKIITETGLSTKKAVRDPSDLLFCILRNLIINKVYVKEKKCLYVTGKGLPCLYDVVIGDQFCKTCNNRNAVKGIDMEKRILIREMIEKIVDGDFDVLKIVNEILGKSTTEKAEKAKIKVEKAKMKKDEAKVKKEEKTKEVSEDEDEDTGEFENILKKEGIKNYGVVGRITKPEQLRYNVLRFLYHEKNTFDTNDCIYVTKSMKNCKDKRIIGNEFCSGHTVSPLGKMYMDKKYPPVPRDKKK